MASDAGVAGGHGPRGRAAKEYSSFLVRSWRLRDDARRLEIEHIQSGQRTRVDSLAAAMDWMSARERPEPPSDDLYVVKRT